MVFSDQIFRVVTTAPFRVENDDTEIYHRQPEKANPKTAMLRRRAGKHFFDSPASYSLSATKTQICRVSAEKSAETPFFSADDER